MVPRTTRRLIPFTATKPANSFRRSWVSRMTSTLMTRCPGASIARLVETPQVRRRLALPGGHPQAFQLSIQRSSPMTIVADDDMRVALDAASLAAGRSRLGGTAVVLGHRPGAPMPSKLLWRNTDQLREQFWRSGERPGRISPA